MRAVLRIRPLVVLLALCCSAAAAQAVGSDAVADKTKAKAKTAVGSATLEEVTADPARVWTRFLAEADLGPAYDRYDAIDAVGYTHTAVDADACRDQAAELRDAVVAVPVSIVLHRVAMMCAEAVGDAAMAEREAAALASLSKHALAAQGDSAWGRPVAVLSPRDVYALVMLLGYEFRYEYYKGVDPKRYLPLVVAAWDPEAKVERHIAFDFIDATAAIDRDDEYSGYPFQRHLLANSFVGAQQKGGEIVGADMAAVTAALSTDDMGQRIIKLREGAGRGGVSSLTNWMVVCGVQKIPGCGDGLIDALLPLAEREHALPMALLAMAYAEGMGIGRDMKSAETLLDAADRHWHQRGASATYAVLDNMMHGGKYSVFALGRLRKAADAGQPTAAALLAAERMPDDPKRMLGAEDIAVLERPSNNGTGLGYAMLAEYYAKRGMTSAAEAARNKAAEYGHAASQRDRALAAIREGGGKAPKAAWWPSMTAAAQGGDAYAMRFLANEAVGAQEWKRAASWLLAAVDAGDIDAIYSLGRLYENENSELAGGLDNAIETYEALAANEGETGAEARRRLALLSSQGRGMKRNPKRAIAWLQPDADRGDVKSQAVLGSLLVNGADGAAGVAPGERWLVKAIAAGSSDARNDYGMWLHNRADSTPESRKRAVALLREAGPDADDSLTIQNNLAWILCVSAHGDTRDPAAGLEVAKRMESAELPPGEIDTVAACYAATGDFVNAAKLQQRAIDGLPRHGKDKAQGGQGMFKRLELYRAGKAYIETRE